MIFYKDLSSAQETIFNIFLVTSYILIFASYVGLSSTAPKYLETIDYYVRIYICLFLLWRFNPFRKLDNFTELDRKITFSAGLFILTTTALSKYISLIKDKVTTIIK
jgi:hypothetical protein